MHLTIREALSIYPLSEAKLVAGKQGESRIVKSVNVMDALILQIGRNLARCSSPLLSR